MRTRADAGSGVLATRLSALVSRNGFLASFAVRFVPGPPSIVVNMALAAAGSRFWPYLSGLAIGVLPKTALIAFAGGSLGKVFQGEFAMAAVLGGAIVLFVLVIVAVRRFIKADAPRP